MEFLVGRVNTMLMVKYGILYVEEIKALQSNLTLDEIQTKEVELLSEVNFLLHSCSTTVQNSHMLDQVHFQVEEMGSKLSKLCNGIVLVKPEDKKLIEGTYIEKINHWRKRKRMFKELWDAITENSLKDLKEFKVFYFS